MKFMKDIVTPPIIFIHYGDCNYLEYSLKSAKLFNPQKRVILIGDKLNKYYERKFNIEHYFFNDYLNFAKLSKLKKAYKIVGGADFEKMNKAKGGKDWTEFNFLKWGVLYNFISKSEIDNFWTFDTDTLIVSDLIKYEKHYKDYDYTIMNNLDQLQGLVNNIEYLKHFVDLAIELLNNEEYLNELKKTDFKENPMWGFTMMRVFRELSIRKNPNIIHLNKIIQNSVFDECICANSNKKMNEYKVGDKIINTVYTDGRGNLYNLDLNSGEYVKLWGINLSWVPDYLFPVLFKIAKQSLSRGIEKPKALMPVNYKKPYFTMTRQFLNKLLNKLVMTKE